MIISGKSLIAAVFIVAAVSAVSAQQTLTDPYEILNRYFQAAGGLDRLKAVKTEYVDGKLVIGAMEGTLRSWSEKPDKLRTDIDLGIFKLTQADNGKFQWTIDGNGKIQKITNPDDASIKRKELKKKLAEYGYAEKNSPVFKIKPQNIEKIDGKDCYAIGISNTINKDLITYYFDRNTFLMEKSVSIEADESNDTYYGDYREISGIKIPFYTKSISHLTQQAQEIFISKYESNIEIDPSVFEPPLASAKDYSFTSGDRAEDIKVIFEGNHVYIPVILECKERYWVLDTGAAMSVISQKFADEIGLEKQGEIKGMGAGGVVTVGLTSLPPFDLQGIHFDKQNVAMVDLKELNKVIDIQTVGILGYDFLSRFVTKIDIANELVSFYDPETFAYSGNGHEVGLHISNSVFLVEAILDKTHAGSWLFDLGASTTSLNGAYALINGFSERKGVEAIGRGASNAFTTKKIKCQSLEFAGYTVEKPIISFHYGGTDSTFNEDRIGILGNTLFRNFVIYCDYNNERLFVEKGDNFNGYFPEDRSGMQITRTDDDKLAVMFVSDGTPASKAGFRADDLIKSINSIDADKFNDLIAIRGLLSDKPGVEYTFVIERDGKEKKLKLKLAEIL